jgi:hypothetical protein
MNPSVESVREDPIGEKASWSLRGDVGRQRRADLSAVELQ